ncbi:MAG: C39 family peptidase [Patescibacteria group bacterium]
MLYTYARTHRYRSYYLPPPDRVRATGHPIIVPVYAPALKNPHYENGGPDYHVLVLTGYDDTDGVFIVNDPGTKDGEGLRFPYDTFMSAIHDLDLENYVAGKKAVLFTKQNGLAEWFAGLNATQ